MRYSLLNDLEAKSQSTSALADSRRKFFDNLQSSISDLLIDAMKVSCDHPPKKARKKTQRCCFQCSFLTPPLFQSVLRTVLLKVTARRNLCTKVKYLEIFPK